MLFNSLGDAQGVLENPFGKIKRIASSPVSREIYTATERELIIEKATGDILDLCLTAMYTGLRKGDICCLTWSSVSEDYNWLHIKHMRKTGKPVDVPILPRFKKHLQNLPRTSEFVFPHLAQLYLSEAVTITKMLKGFLAEIGILGISQAVNGYMKASSLKDIHSFRHTFAYIAAENNVPLPVTQSILGHSSSFVTQIYMNHASMADKQRYLLSMPDFVSGEKPESPIQTIIEMVQQDAPKEEVLAALRELL